MKQCPITLVESKDLYDQLERLISDASYKADFWSPYGIIKKKLQDYQKRWKARSAHILKAPFHIPGAQQHRENGFYMIRKKDLREVVVDG